MKIDYYLMVVFITVISAMVLITLIADNKRLPKTKKTLFFVPLILLILASVAEYFGVILNGAPENTRNIHIILKVLELSVSPVIVFCLISAFNGIEKGKKIIPIAIINFIIHIISGFTGLLFYVDSENVYHHNSFYALYTIIYIVCGIIFFSECIRFSRHYQNRNAASLIAILIFLVMGLSIHNTVSYLRADWLTLSIAYILFYNYYNTLVEQTDSLTQLLDRKSYDSNLEFLNKASNIIVFDVDDFKSVNDNYGHEAGDVCLNTIAKSIATVYARYGYCYRIGGDEFCVITKKLIDISNINNLYFQELNNIREKSEEFIPSVSLGCSVFDPKNENIQQALKRADDEMYKTKKQKKSSD